MLGPLLCFGLGLFIGFILWREPKKKHLEWSVYIEMDIVSGSSYPLTLKLTRNGKPASLPQGAAVRWAEVPPALGAITIDGTDSTKAVIVGGEEGATGTVTAAVSFTSRDGAAKEIQAESESLSVVIGEPDTGSITVGAELA